MNGVLALGHFCDSHGPCVMLCTQAISEKYPKQPPHSLTVPWCNACKSMEVNEAFISHNGDCTYVTTRTALKQDMAFLLKQACVRSLSCEEETGKEGGAVYFGDCERGHVLSYTFRLPDSLARGFHRLFTIILLMRDKVHLLNSWPFVTKHVRELIDNLTTHASKVNTTEQSERSQRVQRLTTGTPVGSPRSLIQLTDQNAVFSHIHLWFTWILTAGSKVMTEHTNLRLNTAPWINNTTDDGFTLVEMTKSYSVPEENPNPTQPCKFRELYTLLSSDNFKVICYGVFIGLQIVVRGLEEEVTPIIKLLGTLIPQCWCGIVPYSEEYLKPNFCKFLGLGIHVAVPQSNESIIRIDIVDNKYHVKWTGNLPNKLPTVLTKLMKSIEDERLQEQVLKIQVEVLIEEWLNISQTIYWAQEVNSFDKLGRLMQSLGVQNCDMALIKYWVHQISVN